MGNGCIHKHPQAGIARDCEDYLFIYLFTGKLLSECDVVMYQ